MTVHSTKLGESSPLQAGDSDESSYIDISSIGKDTLRVTLRDSKFWSLVQEFKKHSFPNKKMIGLAKQSAAK